MSVMRVSVLFSLSHALRLSPRVRTASRTSSTLHRALYTRASMPPSSRENAI